MIVVPPERHMSRNDTLQLDAHFSNWTGTRGADLQDVKPFYLYCVEHALKATSLSDQDLLNGVTDGPSDGGIDALYFILDGENVTDDTPRPNLQASVAPRIRLILFNIKDGQQGFQPTEIDKMTQFLPDLLDVQGLSENKLRIKYNQALIQIITTFRKHFRAIAGRIPEVTMDCYYITRRDEATPDVNALNAVERLKIEVKKHMSATDPRFHFINPTSLLEIIRTRKPNTPTLEFSVAPMSEASHYVGVVKLRDFFGFIRNEDGSEAKRLYDSNVRGYQRDTNVNVQIRETLESSLTDFWLLNNGVTILASSADSSGGNTRLVVSDPQIVNGLQTSRAIFNHFSGRSPAELASDSRHVLVRVIVSTDSGVYDQIVRATNSQNKMPAASLRATDPIHKQIEDVFLAAGLYYDRRKGHYKDENKPASQIVSISQVLQNVICMVLHRPDDARARPGNYLLSQDKYDAVFGSNVILLSCFVKCTEIMRRVERRLIALIPDRGERRNVKFYVAYWVACKETGKLNPNDSDLCLVDAGSINDSSIDSSVREVQAEYRRLGANDTVAKGSRLLGALHQKWRQS